MKQNFKQISKIGIATYSLISIFSLSGCSASDIRTMVSGGDSMSTSTVNHASTRPEQVKLFYSKSNEPKHFQVIGRVTANNDNMIGIPHGQATISAELKKQAASLGANGVINISSGLENTSGEAVLIK
jgi:hypothetical protein